MNDKPHHHGHRKRLRERFMNGGSNALPDYELLELVLFQAHPRLDVKPLAKQLITHFGSFADVISATPQRLSEVKGVGPTVIASLKVINEAAIRLAGARIKDKPILASWTALIDYCQASMAFGDKEQFRVLFLDKKNRLIADEVLQEGTVDHTPVYPREVAKRALEVGATAIILVHNHPSGDPRPSKSDIDMTKTIVKAGETLGIMVHDHIIICRGDYSSFKTMGLL
jgi:DNA repair protein RadC